MTVAERLRHVDQKVERAKKHIIDVDQELAAFYRSTPYKVAVKVDPGTRRPIYHVASAAATPDVLALSAGDAIQNLVSALDHLAYQLVGSDTGDKHPKPAQIYFPIAEDLQSYDANKHRKMDGAAQQTIGAIDAIQPYKGGNDDLWMLAKLNNIEKHRLLITVGSAFESLDLGAHISAAHNKAFPDMKIPSMSTFLRPADVLFPLKAGDELFIDLPDAEINEAMQFRFNVALNEPRIVEGKPLLETLKKLQDNVERTVVTLTPILR